jgi:hypothetical protein
MAGPVEEGAKVATGVVDALKTQPALLGLLVANLAMLAFIFYALSSAASFREQSLANQYKLMQETQQLLAKCVVPDKTKARAPTPTLPLRPAVELSKPAAEDLLRERK